MMEDDTIGQYRIYGDAQKHRFGQTLTVSSLEDKEQFFLYKFPALRALASQRSYCEDLITKWNETLHTSMLSGREHNAETALPRVEIIGSSLVSIHPFVKGVWLNSMPPLSIYHALQVFQQVGREVASIHERGWVHGMLEADHILIDCTGQAHLITPPLSWLDEILQDESREDLSMELFEETPHFGAASVSTDVSRLLSLVYHLFAATDCGELMSDAMHLRGNLREGIPLQLEMVLAQLSDVSQQDSILSVTQLMELVSSCFSLRIKRRYSKSTILREEEICDAVDNDSPENPREESQRARKKRGRLMSQSVLFTNFIEKLTSQTRVLVDLCMKCIAQWASLLPFPTPLRAGLLSVGICSFIISVSLLVGQTGHQVAEPAKPDWQSNGSDKSSDTKDKRRSYALTEVPLPKFFEEYGGDEYGGFIE